MQRMTILSFIKVEASSTTTLKCVNNHFSFFKGKKVLAIYFFGPSNSLENVEIFSLAAWVSCHEGFKGGRYLKKVDLPQLALQLSKSWFRALKLIFRDNKGVILMVSCCSKFLRKKTWKKKQQVQLQLVGYYLHLRDFSITSTM